MERERGNLLYKEGKFEEAIAVYSEGLASSEAVEKASLFFNRAMAHFAIGKFENSIMDCTEALNLNPSYSKALYRRILALEQVGKFSEAIEDFRTLETTDPVTYAERKDDLRRIEIKANKKLEADKAEMMDSLKSLGNSILGNFGLSLDNFALEKSDNGSYSVKMK